MNCCVGSQGCSAPRCSSCKFPHQRHSTTMALPWHYHGMAPKHHHTGAIHTVLPWHRPDIPTPLLCASALIAPPCLLLEYNSGTNTNIQYQYKYSHTNRHKKTDAIPSPILCLNTWIQNILAYYGKEGIKGICPLMGSHPFMNLADDFRNFCFWARFKV